MGLTFEVEGVELALGRVGLRFELEWVGKTFEVDGVG